ncbi:unnamed protein product [Cylindrotheca closterium]|uniref:Helicase-associated domain-containing protein n=1 Tax=Cylindrotheca closterium TaxID=2856 RepID=A0AAD2CLX9_9STRA|nr:unnamed protein product [Cylindrotheca closterium]
MIFSTDNDKLHKDSQSYSDLLDDGLLSPMQCALPSFEMTVSSAVSYTSPPALICFDDPFDDPRMEPIPLRPHAFNDKQQLTSLQSVPHDDVSSLFVTDHDADGLPSSVVPLKKPSETELRQDLLDIMEPIIFNQGESKRSLETVFSDCDLGPSSVKRQRTHHMMPQDTPADAGGDECTARFRPYQETQWQNQFQKLVQYKLKYGHCSVPHSCKDDPILARWVKRQRYQYKKFCDRNPTSTMTSRRIQGLESLGFVWKSHASAWEEKLNELKAFKQQRGHCNVPAHHPDNTALSTWVKSQRRQFKLFMSGASTNMTKERLQVLQSMDFVFDASNHKTSGTF